MVVPAGVEQPVPPVPLEAQPAVLPVLVFLIVEVPRVVERVRE